MKVQNLLRKVLSGLCATAVIGLIGLISYAVINYPDAVLTVFAVGIMVVALIWIWLFVYDYAVQGQIK